LAALNLKPGPWIQAFKHALYNGSAPDTPIEIPHNQKKKRLSLGMLSEKIATISPGQKISYITDVLFSSENIDKIIDLASGSDQLYIEAAFLDNDRRVAREKYHLTAAQAGRIAGMLAAKKVIPFHYSPRYADQAALLEAETAQAFKMTRPKQ